MAGMNTNFVNCTFFNAREGYIQVTLAIVRPIGVETNGLRDVAKAGV